MSLSECAIESQGTHGVVVTVRDDKMTLQASGGGLRRELTIAWRDLGASAERLAFVSEEDARRLFNYLGVWLHR